MTDKEELAIEIVVTADHYEDGKPTTVVSVFVNGVPSYDADGPTMEFGLLMLVEQLARKLEEDA